MVPDNHHLDAVPTGDQEDDRQSAPPNLDHALQEPNGTEPPLRLRWWHPVIGLALVALVTLLAPRGRSLEFAGLTEGSISPSKIIAPFDFEILKSTDELERERHAAAAEILPVVMDSDSIKSLRIRELLAFASESYKDFLALHSNNPAQVSAKPLQAQASYSGGAEEAMDTLRRRFGFKPSPQTWDFLSKLYLSDAKGSPGLYFQFFEKTLRGILGDVYTRCIVDVSKSELAHPSQKVMLRQGGEESPKSLENLLTPEEAMARVASLLTDAITTAKYPQGAAMAGAEILRAMIVPSGFYDRTETEAEREAAVARVPIARGLVKKDELIVDSNIRITKEHVEEIASLAIKRVELESDRSRIAVLQPVLGHALLALLVISLFGVFIAIFRPAISQDAKLILIVAIVIAIIHTFQVLILARLGWSIYMFPAAVGAMLLAILVDRGIALGGVVVMALLAGLLAGNSFPIALGAVATGGAALLGVKQVQKRGDVMRTGFYVLAVAIPVVIAFSFTSLGSFKDLTGDLAVAATNALLSPILVMGLAFIFERSFGITTDLTLLELVDLNQPLLRELALKSPGTYHHSIMVGSLAEAAARAVGANALLTRAGAYYHDIGKIVNKEYFIENQELGSLNVHDRISPEKSARIVIDHIRMGMELADKHHIPVQVKAFIGEHHGKTRVAYFYDKAQREMGVGTPDWNYKYPGPNPRSKETGILMLADLVEAATRSEEHHEGEELREAVDALIKKRLTEGDLDQTPLSLNELNLIRESFVQVLSGIYHQRIAYPGQKERKRARAARANIG